MGIKMKLTIDQKLIQIYLILLGLNAGDTSNRDAYLAIEKLINEQ